MRTDLIVITSRVYIVSVLPLSQHDISVENIFTFLFLFLLNWSLSFYFPFFYGAFYYDFNEFKAG